MSTTLYLENNRSVTKRFVSRAVFFLLLVIAATWITPGLGYLTRIALSYGGLISAFLSFTGFFLLCKSRGAGAREFIRLVIGGMVVRLLLAILAIGLGLGLFGLPAGALVGSCLASYVVLTIIEHIYLFPLLSGKSSH